jgi:pilus assembly protein FimV
MKVRKLAVALALAGGLGSGVAQALGLGEIELQSYLNEPLDADINLRKSSGIDPDNVFVSIASPRDFERVGLDRSHFLTQLDFKVTTAPDGSLVINVTSRKALREPYLNFLVEVTWPQGRLMREYAVLVDPPMYAEESGLQEEVTAPSATTATSSSRPPAAGTRQRTDQARPATRSAAGQVGPTGSSDTLWSIAERVRPDNSLSIQQVMLALQDLNPDAFIGGNINRLKRGQVLRVPTTEPIRARTRAEANRLVSAQNRALQQDTQRPVDATEATSGQAPAQAATPAGDELKLVVDEGSAEDGAAAGDGELPGGVDAGEAVAREELEAARRENEELNSRLQDMQEQVKTLQRLVELKNNQLAEMQQMGGEDEPAGQATAGQPAATGEPETAGSAAGDTAEEDMAAEQAAAEESGADAAAPQPAPPVQEPRKAFPGNVVDMIVNNPVYQIALGAGLLLLLVLLALLARRNSHREKAFYEQLNSEDEGPGSEAIDLDVGEEAMPELEGDDPLAEADAYIAYGRHDQAAQALEAAISREPSRTDLRLKLLGIYADLKERESFDKQFNEIAALDDSAATAEAEALRTRLEEAEATPSIDELESQLRSGAFSSDSGVNDQTLVDQAGEEKPEDQPETADEFDGDFGSLGLDEAVTPDESGDQPEQWRQGTAGEGDAEKTKAGGESAEAEYGHDMIEYDLSGLEDDKDSAESATDESAREDAVPRGRSSDEEFEFEIEEDSLEGPDTELADSDLDFGLIESESGSEADYSGFEESLEQPRNDYGAGDEDDLSLDLSEDDQESGLDLEPEDEAAAPEPLPGEEPGETEAEDLPAEADTASQPEDNAAEPDLDDLDESFLDDLDAELDKVATEDEFPGEQEESLDDLELDVSDEDIALMQEFAEADVEEEPGSAADEVPGLEDAFTGEEEASPEDSASADEVLGEPPLVDEDQPEDALTSLDDTSADEAAYGKTGKSALDLDESELGEDDDFDFLSGTDEAATKLDLARAYMEMGDVDGARDILEEVTLEGNDEQKAEAQDLLKNLS